MGKIELDLKPNWEIKPQREQLVNLYDALVVMPYSSNLRENGDARLSFYSALAVVAAADLYRQRVASRIIVPGESIFGDENSSTTDLMLRYLVTGQPKISKENIIAEERLNNTIYQLLYIKELQERQGLNKLLIVAMNWHMDRVVQTMRNFNIQGDVIEVEGVLAQTRRAKQEELLAVAMTRNLTQQDVVLRKIMLIDKFGLLQRALVEIRGPRVVDLYENSYAKDVLRRKNRF